MKKKVMWRQFPIVSRKDVPLLERHAALYEFRDGHSRDESEALAWKEYTKQHHLEASAHHLRAQRAAEASGDSETARMHSQAYSRHVSELGHDMHGEVPEEVMDLVDEPSDKAVVPFRGHPADSFFHEDKDEEEKD